MVSESASYAAYTAGAADMVIAATIIIAMILVVKTLFFISFPLFSFVFVTEKMGLQKASLLPVT